MILDESIVKVFEQQKVGTLKLSQAMRIGAKIRPQCSALPFFDKRSCAIGAAYEGATGRYINGAMQSDLVRELQVMGVWPRAVMSHSVWAKNDVAGMTREAIADWLEGQGY